MKTPDVGGADTGVRCEGSALAECGLASEYYKLILDQHFYWQR